MYTRLLSLLSVLSVLGASVLTSAAVPQLINYQGRLTTPAGQPVDDGNYAIKFVIYDAPIAGTVLWDNNFRTVQIAGGQFTYALGDSTALPTNLFAADTTRWLGITVGADPELTPRVRFTSVPFSYKALRADTSGHAIDIADNSVTSAKIQDGSIAFADVGQNSASTGQVIKWSGVAWAPANDEAGGASGWTDAGAVVRLTTSSDKVGLGTSAPNEQLEITGNLRLPATTATTGIIKSGANTYIHNWGYRSLFLGESAGNLTMSGIYNTGCGVEALGSTTTGTFNTAVGEVALKSNTTGNCNTATGEGALCANDEGNFNTATGKGALSANTEGDNNTAGGHYVLRHNTTGSSNTAFGDSALQANTTANLNTATGHAALYSNTTGHSNTASGSDALRSNTAGYYNTAIGYLANVSAGNLTNATVIGANATVNASNMIRLGDANVTVIEGQVAYTFTSDKNQKENFQQVNSHEVLRKIAAMSITSWNYKGNDPNRFRHYGPVAQEFFAAFGHDGVGTCGDSTTINSGDLAGIMMIAIQELSNENQVMKVELTLKSETIDNLTGELLELKQALKLLTDKVAGETDSQYGFK